MPRRPRIEWWRQRGLRGIRSARFAKIHHEVFPDHYPAWTAVEHAVLGRFPMLGRPYTLEKTPWRIRHAAPMLGEHTDAILTELGHDTAQIAALREEGAVA